MSSAGVHIYRGVLADETREFENGARFRFVAYSEIAGKPAEAGGVAVFDETRKLVLVDGLYSDSRTGEALLRKLAALKEGGVSALVEAVNGSPVARHQLDENGSPAW